MIVVAALTEHSAQRAGAGVRPRGRQVYMRLERGQDEASLVWRNVIVPSLEYGKSQKPLSTNQSEAQRAAGVDTGVRRAMAESTHAGLASLHQGYLEWTDVK